MVMVVKMASMHATGGVGGAQRSRTAVESRAGGSRGRGEQGIQIGDATSREQQDRHDRYQHDLVSLSW